MLGVACDGVLGTNSKYEKKNDVIWGAGHVLGIFRRDFPNSRTEEDSASILVSKCAELSISYILLRD